MNIEEVKRCPANTADLYNLEQNTMYDFYKRNNKHLDAAKNRRIIYNSKYDNSQAYAMRDYSHYLINGCTLKNDELKKII